MSDTQAAAGHPGTGQVRIEPGGPVRTVTIDRPDKRNALTGAMFASLLDAFRQPPPEGERLTVLRAEGPVFCAGVDLSERVESPDPGQPNQLEQLCEAIRTHPLPVVAVVQGAAVGGGLMIALHCDFVVAASDARLGNPAAQLGLVPPWSLSRTLLEVAGPVLGRELLLLGDPLTAARLAHAGVITEAVPAGQLASAVARVVDRLAANAPLSLRAIKATLGARPEIDHTRVDELIARARRGPDGKEGVRARRERRAPRFTGR